MRYIFSYNEEFINPIKSFRKKRRDKKDKIEEDKRISKWRYEDFNDDDINLVDDMFLEIQEKYQLEKDTTGEILNYININAPNKKGRNNPQFFIENSRKLLIFSIASSKPFITDELIYDIQNFKNRLLKFNLKCSENDIERAPWIKYLSFYITKFK